MKHKRMQQLIKQRKWIPEPKLMNIGQQRLLQSHILMISRRNRRVREKLPEVRQNLKEGYHAKT